MDRRIELQAKLEAALGSRNVYYNPPETVKMSYPAIVYSRGETDHVFANDSKYLNKHAYNVIVISKKPDSPVAEEILTWPLTRRVRDYTSDNLYHNVLNVYYD